MQRKCSYLAIERQFASAGTEIAGKVSELTGVPCYGKEILRAVSEKYGMSESSIENYEEKATGSLLYSLFVMSRLSAAEPDLVTKEGHVFIAEQQAIRVFAANGPAIFLGHCACEALKGRAGVVKVFIKADYEDRKRRAVEEYGLSPEEAGSAIKRFDRKRANYFYANTSRKWDDLSGYDVVLDSSALSVDGCVRALSALFVRG